MVRPVDGFMAEDGTFFPTEAECEIYEARLAVTSLVMEKLGNEIGVHSGDVNMWTEAILDWVDSNFDKFARFHFARQSMTIAEPPELEQADPPTLSDDPDDLPF